MLPCQAVQASLSLCKAFKMNACGHASWNAIQFGSPARLNLPFRKEVALNPSQAAPSRRDCVTVNMVSTSGIGHRLVNYVASAVKWPVPYSTKFKVFGAIHCHDCGSVGD